MAWYAFLLVTQDNWAKPHKLGCLFLATQGGPNTALEFQYGHQPTVYFFFPTWCGVSLTFQSTSKWQTISCPPNLLPVSFLLVFLSTSQPKTVAVVRQLPAALDLRPSGTERSHGRRLPADPRGHGAHGCHGHRPQVPSRKNLVGPEWQLLNILRPKKWLLVKKKQKCWP